MSKSHTHQQTALLTALVNRARDGLPGLSKPSMVLSYGFHSEAQLDHAISKLVEAGAITVDIDGRYPSFRIHKTRMRTLQALRRPLFVSSGTPTGAGVAGDWRKTVATTPKPAPLPAQVAPAAPVTAATASQPAPPEKPTIQNPPAPPTPPPPVRHEAPAAPPVRAAAQPRPAPTVAPRDAHMAPATPGPARTSTSPVEAALALETERDQAIPFYVGFRLPKDDFNWLVEEMDRSGEAVALPGFARDMLLAEMDRRRSPEGPRHKISARVLRTAREEGLDLDTFVTSLIEVGLTAREMNRRGV